jgi:acetyl-CoA synthetase
MARGGYKPVLEYCGGTEVGGAFCGGTLLHPCVPSAFPTPTLGFELFLLDSGSGAGAPVATPRPRSMSERSASRGEVALRAPALGTSQRLLNRDHWQVYFDQMPRVDAVDTSAPPQPLRRHGDEFEVLPGLGYFRAHGRCDDTMNLGGIKVCTLWPRGGQQRRQGRPSAKGGNGWHKVCRSSISSSVAVFPVALGMGACEQAARSATPGVE